MRHTSESRNSYLTLGFLTFILILLNLLYDQDNLFLPLVQYICSCFLQALFFKILLRDSVLEVNSINGAADCCRLFTDRLVLIQCCVQTLLPVFQLTVTNLSCILKLQQSEFSLAQPLQKKSRESIILVQLTIWLIGIGSFILRVSAQCFVTVLLKRL